MDFKTIAKNTVKGALVAFAVGALLAVAAPVIANWTNVSMPDVGLSANPLWLGSFFGAWGALAAMVQPAVDYMFGDAKKGKELTQIVVIREPARTPERAREAPSHTQRLDAERALSKASPGRH